MRTIDVMVPYPVPLVGRRRVYWQRVRVPYPKEFLDVGPETRRMVADFLRKPT